MRSAFGPVMGVNLPHLSARRGMTDRWSLPSCTVSSRLSLTQKGDRKLDQMKQELQKKLGVDDECLSFCRAFTKTERDLARLCVQTLHQAIKDCRRAPSIVIARQFRELLRSEPYEALLQTAIQAILRQDDRAELGSLSMSVVPSVNPRAESEGHVTVEAQRHIAPSARGPLSVPSAEGDGAGDDQASDEAQQALVSPALSKSLPAPIREPSAQRLSAMLAARLDAARTIMETSLPTGPGNHRISLGSLPASTARLDRMIRALGKRTGEGAITYNILIRLREHCGRIAHIPLGATLKDLLSEQDAVDLVKSARITTIETLFSLPRELPVSEDFAVSAAP
jgi:hypothetical protein